MDRPLRKEYEVRTRDEDIANRFNVGYLTAIKTDRRFSEKLKKDLQH